MKFHIPKTVQLILKIAIILLLAAYVFFAYFRPIELDDVWWHLACGRWIVQNHAVPHVDPFSFTDTPTPWILAQWLGSVTFYLVHNVTGVIGLKTFRLLIFVGSFFIFLFFARKKVSFAYFIVLFFLLVQGISTRCLVRPLIFNFIFIQIFLLLLLNYEKKREIKNLIWLVLVGALWSNIHLGAFVYGSLLIGTFFLSFIIQYGNFLIEKRKIIYSKPHAIPVRDLFLTLLFFWLSMVINPYGIEAFLYPWKTFFVPTFLRLNQAFSSIIESMAPNILDPGFHWIYSLILLGVFSVILSKKDITLTLLLIFSAFSLLSSIRGHEFGVIVFVYCLALLNPPQERKGIKKYIGYLFSIYKIFLFLTTLAILLTFVNVAKNACVEHKKIKRGLAFEQYDSNIPIAAIELLKTSPIEGPAYCTDNLGTYIAWSLYPKVRPFVDGRQITSYRFFEEYSPASDDPENKWEPLDKKYNFKIVFLNLKYIWYLPLAKFLKENPQWQLVFVDGANVLFVKKDAFALPKDMAEYQNSLKKKRLTSEQKTMVKDLANKTVQSTRAQGKFCEIKDVEEAIILSELGFEDAAIEKVINAQNHCRDACIVPYIAEIFNRLFIEKKTPGNKADADKK